MNDEVAVFNPDVVGAAGIILEFVVAPAAAAVADVEGPIGGVDGGFVEFITPDEVPIRAGLNGPYQENQADQVSEKRGHGQVGGGVHGFELTKNGDRSQVAWGKISGESRVESACGKRRECLHQSRHKSDQNSAKLNA